MFVFCFNDCIPQNHSDEVADRCLNNSLREYHKLTQQFPGAVDGIVTSYAPSSVRVSQDCSLHDCICRIADRELKIYAYSFFTKYPYELHCTIGDEDELIKGNYYTTINGIKHNAVNLIIASRNQGVLFSLAVHEDICKNQIPVFADDDQITNVNNLFGQSANTEYLAKIIRQSIYDKADNFNKLLITVGENKFSDRFKKNFESFPANVQQAVIEHFTDAINRKLYTRFYPDDKLIKDVTPSRELNIKVYELRIFRPVGCRVYFYETPHCVYLGLIEHKPSKNRQTLLQDSHIMTARNIIRELASI